MYQVEENLEKGSIAKVSNGIWIIFIQRNLFWMKTFTHSDS
jgi:hypothetical protein